MPDSRAPAAGAVIILKPWARRRGRAGNGRAHSFVHRLRCEARRLCSECARSLSKLARWRPRDWPTREHCFTPRAKWEGVGGRSRLHAAQDRARTAPRCVRQLDGLRLAQERARAAALAGQTNLWAARAIQSVRRQPQLGRAQTAGPRRASPAGRKWVEPSRSGRAQLNAILLMLRARV